MSYQVCMDDIPMDQVAPSARIVDVIESAPGYTTESADRPLRHGSFLLRHHLKEKRVQIHFTLLEQDFIRRTEALSAIAAWAQGKWLQTGDRPGQQLRVVCTELPSTQSKRDWTALCAMSFTAFSVPYWEDVQGVSVRATGTCCDMRIVGPGNVKETYLRCKVNPSAELHTLRISSGAAQMAFTGISVPAGALLSIDYDDGILTASWAGADGHETPCLASRTGDEGIPIRAGEINRVTVETDVTADVTISARGLYW